MPSVCDVIIDVTADHSVRHMFERPGDAADATRRALRTPLQRRA
jgi:hypothetical protein